jgi:hypothetical protein
MATLPRHQVSRKCQGSLFVARGSCQSVTPVTQLETRLLSSPVAYPFPVLRMQQTALAVSSNRSADRYRG